MTFYKHLVLASAFTSILAAMPAAADPKPKGAKPLDAQSVANLYAGKTVEWSGCKGGIYYGAKYQAQAYCSKDGEATGLGKWKLTNKGSICHNLIWYWQEGDSYGSKPQDKKVDYINHLVDADGKIWRNWTGNKDWWGVDPKKLKKGFKFKRKVNKLRKKIGI